MTGLVFAGLRCIAQDLSGTWEGVFYSDRLGKRTSYNIRFFLEQENTNVWGLCEAMSVESSPGTGFAYGTLPLKCRYPVSGDVTEILEKNSPVSFHSKIPVTTPVSTDFCENITSFFLNYDVVDDSIAQLSGEWVSAGRPAIGMPGYSREVLIKKISGKTPGFIEEFFPRAIRRTKELKGEESAKKRNEKEKKEPRIKWPFFKKKKETEEEVFVEKKNDSTSVALQNKPDSLTAVARIRDIQEILYTDTVFIQVDIYDNGLVDGDVISLFLNENLVVDRKKISAKALHLELRLDPLIENTIRLFAENTGEIPPNTALMVVRAGNRIYNINLSASLQRDAVIMIKVTQDSR